jgi:ADP-ribosylglycohydrolase
MLGAIAGDIIGSVYEFNNIKSKDFPLFSQYCDFTDDTVLTVAVADAILNGDAYVGYFKSYFHRYPNRGYGGNFSRWGVADSLQPYYSFGNGSAMRVSPVGFAFDNLQTVCQEAERTAQATHNHPEGIKGAVATATAIFLARTGSNTDEIRYHIEQSFGYDLSQSLASIRPHYSFDVSCQGSVPQAMVAFLESTDFEDAIRNAISLGGDSDTIACITGGIAHAYYGGVPDAIAASVWQYLDNSLKEITKRFLATYDGKN